MNNQFINLFLLSIIEIFGDFSYKYYTYTSNFKYLIYGFISYLGVQYFLINALRNSSVLYVNGMWDGLSGLVESIASMIFLGERLTDYTQYLGLILIIIGIVLLKANKDYKYK